MHKLIDYICDELEELEHKAEKDGKLSMAEVEYMDTLAHAKKNLMKADEMEYSGAYDDMGMERSYRSSMARGRRRDSMGRYSRDSKMMVTELRELMREAPEETKGEFRRFIQKIEDMS